MAYILLFFFIVPLFGQGQPVRPMPASTAAPANFLPKDSPHLYRLYFYFHTTIDGIVQQQKAGRTPLEVQRIAAKRRRTSGFRRRKDCPCCGL
jgi:hypothetical protein